jgi:hypothetical protein
MKASFTRRMKVSLYFILLAGLPWSCVDHVDPNTPVEVTCSCQVLDNSGPIGTDTRKLNCPGGKFTCVCGNLAQRGGVAEFHCD